MEGAEKRISELENRTIQITQSEKQRENRLAGRGVAGGGGKKKFLWELWDYSKRSNAFVIGSWKERRIGRAEKVHKEIMATNSPRHKHRDSKAEWAPNKINLKKSIPKYIKVKFLKNKDNQNLKGTGEKHYFINRERQFKWQQASHQKSERSRRNLHNIFQMLKEKRSADLEFYTQWKYSSGMKSKSRCSQMKKNQKNLPLAEVL